MEPHQSGLLRPVAISLTYLGCPFPFCLAASRGCKCHWRHSVGRPPFAPTPSRLNYFAICRAYCNRHGHVSTLEHLYFLLLSRVCVVLVADCSFNLLHTCSKRWTVRVQQVTVAVKYEVSFGRTQENTRLLWLKVVQADDKYGISRSAPIDVVRK